MDERYNYIDRVCYRVAPWLSNNIGCNQVGGLLVKILGLKVSWASDSLLAIFSVLEIFACKIRKCQQITS